MKDLGFGNKLSQIKPEVDDTPPVPRPQSR